MKSYLRFLGRNKLYTAIEIVGLSVALAFVIPLVNLLIDKKESCQAHQSYEDIYAVAYGGNLMTDPVFGEYLKERVPEIEYVSSARIGPVSDIDSEFFRFFPFEFVEGNESFLELENNVAISDKYAQIITDGSPVGKSIRLENKEYMIAAVFKSGRNDILKECDILKSAEFLKRPNQNGRYSPGITLVWLKEGYDRQEVERKILSVADEYKQGDEQYLELKGMGVFRGLVRYDELPENTVNYGTFKMHRSAAMLFLYIIIGLIFIVAILNYINLNVAVSTTRAKENATRKLAGATGRQLIIKGLTESLLFTFICFILGLLLSGHIGSFIKSLLAMTGFTDFSCEPSYNPGNIISFIAIIIVTAFVAGISPAVISSRFTPLQVTKGDLRYHNKKRLSKFFIGFQTILSIILISGVLMLDSCYKEGLKIDFNCDIEDVGYIKNINDKASVVASQVRRNPEILSAGLTSMVPVEGFNGVLYDQNKQQFLLSNIHCDKEGFETFGFEILEQYSEDINGLWLTPYTKSVIERDSLLMDSILGATKTVRIAGIINDFPGMPPFETSQQALTSATVGGEIFRPGVVFKTNGDNEYCRKTVDNILKEICYEEVIETNMIDVRSKYVLEILEEKLSPIRFTIDLIAMVMGLVVLMTMMGLVGMSIHYTNERRNEIAVRKVFGASEDGELIRNLRFYLIVTSVALVPAICLTELLRNMIGEFGIHPHNVWLIYISAIVLSFTFSIASVFLQTYRAARTNPAEALKKE